MLIPRHQTDNVGDDFEVLVTYGYQLIIVTNIRLQCVTKMKNGPHNSSYEKSFVSNLGKQYHCK